MTYAQTVDKINRVIDKCTKAEQLVMAKKYSHMLVGVYVKEYKRMHDGASFKTHFVILDILDQFTERIKRLCAEWITNNEPMIMVEVDE